MSAIHRKDRTMAAESGNAALAEMNGVLVAQYVERIGKRASPTASLMTKASAGPRLRQCHGEESGVQGCGHH